MYCRMRVSSLMSSRVRSTNGLPMKRAARLAREAMQTMLDSSGELPSNLQELLSA